jgi:hypothetical protein
MAAMEPSYMLIGLKDATSNSFCSLDELYTWVCEKKGVTLENNVAEILKLCKRMDGRVGIATDIPVAHPVTSSANKEVTVPFNSDSMARLLPNQSEPVKTTPTLTLEEKLRSINEFNVPSQAIPLNYTDYKHIRQMTDTAASAFVAEGFTKKDPELEADHELNKADAMKRLKETVDSADKPPLAKMEMKLLEEWFLTNTHASTENYVTPYCYNIFLTFYDGTSECFRDHGLPSVNNLPSTLTEFFKYSYPILESPPASKYIIDDRYFNSYRTIVTTLSQNGVFRSEKLAFGLYKDYHKNRVSILTLEPWVLEFLQSCCKQDIPEESTKSSVLYSKFVEWVETIWEKSLNSNYYLALKGIISQKGFSSILKSSTGLKPIRKSDGIYWPGISLGRGKGIPEKEYPTLAGYDDKEYGAPIETLKSVDNKTLLGF